MGLELKDFYNLKSDKKLEEQRLITESNIFSNLIMRLFKSQGRDAFRDMQHNPKLIAAAKKLQANTKEFYKILKLDPKWQQHIDDEMK